MRIAGKNTAKQWKALQKRLQAKPTPRLWDSAYRRFYRLRLDTRYLVPIKSIKQHDSHIGEGFAIAALFCSLVEFLESCEKGDNFHVVGKTGYKLQSNEYSERQASGYFKDFLKTRPPFNALVPAKLVDSFYQDVRCGLLHEARTKGKWFISTSASGGQLISRKKGKVILYRNELLPALETYFTDYRTRLMSDSSTQQALIRKFEHLCKP